MATLAAARLDSGDRGAHTRMQGVRDAQLGVLPQHGVELSRTHVRQDPHLRGIGQEHDQQACRQLECGSAVEDE